MLLPVCQVNESTSAKAPDHFI